MRSLHELILSLAERVYIQHEVLQRSAMKKKPVTKFLCICHYGHSRSAAMVRVLHARDFEALCCGVITIKADTIWMLMSWADAIVFMDKVIADRFPMPILHRLKVHVADLGADKWSNPYNPELLKLCEQFADQFGWVKS